MSTLLPTLKPAFVVVTGDLTDAKDQHLLSSKQYREEWVSYHTILMDSHILNKPNFWFDMRGNHDCFNIGDEDANMYKVYSVAKQEGWIFDYHTEFGFYKFIALDAW